MAQSLDLFETPESELPWPRVRAWLEANPEHLIHDRALLEALGLRATGKNVVEFGQAALTRLEAVVERETSTRRQIETIARANFAAQTQTHVAALDLMEARNHSDLARRLDGAAQGRFGLTSAVIAVEKPGGVPFGWRALEPGRVDALLGEHGLHWLGPAFDGMNLFGAQGDEVKSVALIRMAPVIPNSDPAQRPALCAFGSPDPDGFTPIMGCELAAFVTRVVERMIERWPVLS